LGTRPPEASPVVPSSPVPVLIRATPRRARRRGMTLSQTGGRAVVPRHLAGHVARHVADHMAGHLARQVAHHMAGHLVRPMAGPHAATPAPAPSSAGGPSPLRNAHAASVASPRRGDSLPASSRIRRPAHSRGQRPELPRRGRARGERAGGPPRGRGAPRQRRPAVVAGRRGRRHAARGRAASAPSATRGGSVPLQRQGRRHAGAMGPAPSSASTAAQSA
jgi:hypothetical protein